VADAFSRLCEHHQENDAHVGAIHTLRLGGRADSATEEQLPVTAEPSIPPLIRAQIEKVHNSVVEYFGEEYTRKALLGRGVIDQGL
jgi:hypothetical protein